MSATDAWQNIVQHVRAVEESAKARLEQDLPEVEQFFASAAASPVTAALSAAVHVPEAPEALQLVASFIQQLDGMLAAQKAAAASA